MTTVLLAMIATALPADFAWELPEVPAPVAQECPQAVDLVPGRPVPPELLDPEGNVRCFGTVVPTSDLAHLLLVDAWAAQALPRGTRQGLELAWQEERYQRLAEAFGQPTPVLQRPATQRVLGRVETVAVMALAVGLYAVLDSRVVNHER